MVELHHKEVHVSVWHRWHGRVPSDIWRYGMVSNFEFYINNFIAINSCHIHKICLNFRTCHIWGNWIRYLVAKLEKIHVIQCSLLVVFLGVTSENKLYRSLRLLVCCDLVPKILILVLKGFYWLDTCVQGLVVL